MTTVHANTARDALSRLETMVLMAGFDLPMRAIREQIAVGHRPDPPGRPPARRPPRRHLAHRGPGHGGRRRSCSRTSSPTCSAGPTARRPGCSSPPPACGRASSTSSSPTASRCRRPRSSRPSAAAGATQVVQRAVDGAPVPPSAEADRRQGTAPLTCHRLARHACSSAAGSHCSPSGVLSRVYEREEELSQILDLPYGEQDVDVAAVAEQHSTLVENTIGLAGKVIESDGPEGLAPHPARAGPCPAAPGRVRDPRRPCRPRRRRRPRRGHHQHRSFGLIGLLVTPVLAKAFLDPPHQQAHEAVRGRSSPTPSPWSPRRSRPATRSCGPSR